MMYDILPKMAHNHTEKHIQIFPTFPLQYAWVDVAIIHEINTLLSCHLLGNVVSIPTPLVPLKPHILSLADHILFRRMSNAYLFLPVCRWLGFPACLYFYL